MSILGCLDRPTAGHYYFQGRDVAQATAERSALASLKNGGCTARLHSGTCP